MAAIPIVELVTEELVKTLYCGSALDSHGIFYLQNVFTFMSIGKIMVCFLIHVHCVGFFATM